MGLFGTSTPSPPVVQSDPVLPKPTAPAAPAQTGPQAYTAYEKNGLKITLTPRLSPTQPGVVQILARFTAFDGAKIEAVNFQAAVPRVRFFLSSLFGGGGGEGVSEMKKD